MNLDRLEKILSYQFQNKDLLKEALTHRSYLNENSSWSLPYNERLEFLGDAVLELIVTEALFLQFPLEAEGKLTTLRAALVNYQILARLSKQIELEKFLLLSRGEAKDSGKAREVILANAFEAVIGAIYLDGGYEQTKQLVMRVVLPEVKGIIEQGLYRDPKSLLQERVQAELKLTPSYKLLREDGPDHKKNFTVGVYFGDKEIAQGQGLSKQDAEVDAAQKALEIKSWSL